MTPLTVLPLILAVHPSLGVSSVKELIELARSKPGELTYASVGPGTVPHLSTELFSVGAKIKLVHVPYQGSPPAVTDLLAGRVSMMLGVASTMIPHVEAGKLKALAVSSAKRAHFAPNVPTMAEAGLPNYGEVVTWWGVFVPVKTSKPIAEKLEGWFNQIASSDDAKAFLARMGAMPMVGSSRTLADLLAADTTKWGDYVKLAGIEKQ